MARTRPLPSLVARPTTDTTETERPLLAARLLPTVEVFPDPNQPRTDLGSLEGLQASIAEFGILQPLLVRDEPPDASGASRYRIIAGARRHAAALQLGLPMVPVIVRTDAETVRLRTLQLLENLQREDLSPLDEAHAYEELMALTGGTAEDVARRLHISGQKVRERLRLLADQVLADAVGRKQISASVARTVGRLPDDLAAQYRARVQGGEQLTLQTLAQERAQLSAGELASPRLKRKALTAPSDTLETPGDDDADQAMLDPEPVRRAPRDTARGGETEQAVLAPGPNGDAWARVPGEPEADLATLLLEALRQGLRPAQQDAVLAGLRVLVETDDGPTRLLALARTLLARGERPRM